MKENLELMIPDDKDMEEALIKKEQGLISEEKYERMKRFHEHPDETLREALEVAQIADVYYGVDAHGNERCNQMYGSFSGGERQRLALARAILADKEITILDEPTGALDGETTMDVIAGFKEFAKTHNLIMVTHSPDFVANAGKVVVVDDGRIVGDGDAYQLMRTNKFIQNIFKGSPRQILESRRDVYRLMHIDTSQVDEQLVKEAEVSAQYDRLKTDFEYDKKGRFADMREFVARVHQNDVKDATLEAQKRVLSEKNEMSDAYVAAAKKEILARRNKREKN
jgi:ABC-type multidrug transport system ATPase subunit